MKLTPENKAHIDSLSYFGLFEHWRNARIGDPWFEGETGTYWSGRMAMSRPATDEAIITSKVIGWTQH